MPWMNWCGGYGGFSRQRERGGERREGESNGARGEAICVRRAVVKMGGNGGVVCWALMQTVGGKAKDFRAAHEARGLGSSVSMVTTDACAWNV